LSRAAKLIRQAAWASTGQLIQALIAMAGTIILARLLGAETYGIFALGLLFVGCAEILTGGHVADIVVQKEDATPGHRNAAFAGLVGIGAVVSLAVGAAGAFAARFFEVPQLETLLMAVAVLPFLTALTSVPNQILVRQLQFQALARIGSLAALASVISGVGLALAGMGLWSLVIMEIVRRVVTLALLAPASGWWPGLAFSMKELGDVVRFSGRRIENNGLTFLSQSALPRVVIGQWLGTEALGLFVVARRLLDQLNNVLSGPVAAVAFPAASRLQADREKLVKLIISSIRLTTWVFWPVVLGIVVVAPLLVPLAFGEEWSAATPVLQILALGTLRVPVSSFNTAVLVAFGRMGSLSLVSVLSIIVGIAFLSVGVQFGLVGVAAALALRQWVLWPVGSYQVYRVSGLHPAAQLRIMAWAALPSLIMAGCVAAAGMALTLDQSLRSLGILVWIGIGIYLLAWAACNWRRAAASFAAAMDLIKGNVSGARQHLKTVVME
jgi:O-antigen/teichoic acid export membrane protein